MTKTGRKLFIVSYRVPDISNGASSGGLVVALSPFFEASSTNQQFDEIVLCGFSGQTTKKPVNKFEIEEVPGKPFLKRALLKPTEEEHLTGYQGYINGVKWPLEHGLTDLIDVDAIKFYSNYRAMQRRFAQCLSQLMGPNPDHILKIEDYHFEFLADEMRALGHINKIGHFSHIPKARRADYERLSPEIRRHLEMQENDNNRAKLACDVLGFQRQEDMKSFKEHLGVFGPSPAVFDVERTTLSGRSTKLGVFPASIDTSLDSQNASLPITDQERKLIDPRGIIDPKARVVMWAGRDDISKQAHISYQDITAVLRDPDFVRQLRVTQDMLDGSPLHAYGIATETRKGIFGYDEQKAMTRAAHAELVETHRAREGFESATLNELGLPRNLVLKQYRNSVGYFIPARDGCNLGVFEHVAAQDPDSPNPVIVSREAGASDNLPGAIVVDPFNRRECQQALKRALTMKPEESLNRHHANMKVLRRQDSAHQTTSYLNHLIAP